MSYKTKPQIKLYAFQNNAFVLQAIIDDFQEVSFERNLYQAGTFTISINYNIPNSQLFQRGLFVQFGNDPYDFGEIITINDSIGADGKGSQIRTITGYDARYILKRRVIKNMNSNGLWVMTAKGELCLRNLIKDQCGSGAEAKRQLPISNTIPASADAIGKEYSVSEQFTNLYEVCKTIATQSEIGWRLAFDGSGLTLECYEGTDRSQTVQFSTSFDSLADGQFTDSSDSYSNAIYVGGKGQNDERDIYEGENGSPSGLDRFESWDNQSSMTTEAEYEAEALAMLTQYGQTVQMAGNGLAKCPYIYKEQYDVGDIITIAFSGKSAVVQILSVTEYWGWGNYNINFSFGKPQPTQSDQLQLMLRKIQSASNKENATESIKWYDVASVTSMPASDVTFNTIGFTGTMTANKTFTLYLDNEKTGAKSYNIYVKNLNGNYTLTLTTGKSGATNFTLKGGVNLTGRILVDESGNIISQGMTATSTVSSGNSQPVTSGGVFNAIEAVTPTYPVAVNKGGTGQTTALAVVNETIQSGIGLGDAVFEDTTDIVTSHVMGYSTSYKGLYRRKASLLWSYISSKITNWLDTAVTKNSSNPITSGGVANSFSYIKGEMETGGTWIDGKKIYRRVADFTSTEIPLGNSNYVFSSVFWSTIDSLVSIRIIRPKTSTSTYAEISIPLRFDVPNKTLYVYDNPIVWSGPFLLVCEYTKS